MSIGIIGTGYYKVVKSKEGISMLIGIEILYVGINMWNIENGIRQDEITNYGLVILVVTVIVCETGIGLSMYYRNYRRRGKTKGWWTRIKG